MSATKQQKTRRLPLRRHSLAESRSPRANHPRDEGSRSLLRFLINKPWKRRSVSTPAIDKESMAESNYNGEGVGLKEEGGASSIKVVASILQPHLYNKTLRVTMGTTVNDVITKLVTKYAIATEDKNPGSFYLMETHDRSQGSYSRVLSNTDLIRDIRQRWGEEDGYFTLTRRHNSCKVSPLFSSSPSVFSTTEPSPLLPYSAFVEEGTSQLSSQSLSDITGESTLPHHHSTPRTIVSLVSPYSHGASRTLTHFEDVTGSLSRLQDTSMYSSYTTPHSRDPMNPTSPLPLSPTSPLIVESPTHQYVITGSSSSNQINGDRVGDRATFHFPSANPSSPTDTSNHGNNMFNSDTSTCGNHGNNGGARGGEGGGEEITPNTRRRRRLSEMMQSSIEGGLGQIMTLVVAEGRGGQLPARLVGERDDSVERDEEREGEGEGEVEEVEVEGEGEAEGEADANLEVEVEGETEVGEGDGGGVLEEQRSECEGGVVEEGESDMKNENVTTAEETGVTDTQSETETMEKLLRVESHSHVLEPKSSEPIPPHPSVTTLEMTLDTNPKAVTQSLPHSLVQETALTVHPTVHSKSSMYVSSNRSDWFQSEMNMLDSLAALLDENIKETAATREGNAGLVGSHTRTQSVDVRHTTTTSSKPDKPVNLVSPLRRNKLIDEAARKVSRRRAHSRSISLGGDISLQKGDGDTDLLSEARKEKLLSQALAAVRERRQSAAPETVRREAAVHVGKGVRESNL